MERTQRKSKLLSSAVVWAVFLMMWAQFSIGPNAIAPGNPVAYADGETWCGSSACYGVNTNVTVPEEFDVNNGDPLVFAYNIEWLDERSSSSPKATHDFLMTVSYPGRDLYVDNKHVETYGDDGDWDVLLIEVLDVQEYVTITVNWLVNINVNNGDCTDDDSDEGQIYTT